MSAGNEIYFSNIIIRVEKQLVYNRKNKSIKK